MTGMANEKPELNSNKASLEEVADTALNAGMLVLENGGETFRAEETVVHICEAGGAPDSEVFALPTGIFIAARSADHAMGSGTTVSLVKRVKKRTLNLYKLERANSSARSFVRGDISLHELRNKLEELNHSRRRYGKLLSLFAASLSGGMFTLLFGGSWFDFIIAALSGLLVQYISVSFKRTNIYQFAISLIGGLLIGAFAVTSRALFNMGSIDTIAIGAMTPLLPGISMTNAIRDTVMGDLVSGVTRLAETLLVAVALAVGVGVSIAVYIRLGGTV